MKSLMRHHLRTLRFKLAALNLLVFGIILTTLCIVVITVREEYLREDFDERLVDRAESMIKLVEITADEDRLHNAPGMEKLRHNPFRFPGYFFLLRREDGSVLERSRNLQDMALPLTSIGRTSRDTGRPVLETRSDKLAESLCGTGEELRLLTLYRAGADSPPFYLQVGVSLSRVRESVTGLRRLFMAMLPIGFVAVGLASWLMAKRSLSPIGRIAREARGLTAVNLGSRLNIPLGQDEVAEMVTTINQMLERLEAAFRSQERFLADASHELKTPITVLLGEAQVLSRQARTVEEYDRFVASVQDEMRLMAKVVDSLLTLARADAGFPLSETTTVSLNEVVTDAVERCQPLALQREVRLVPVLAMPDSESVDPEVQGDTELLQTMVENLIRNAIRFSPVNGNVKIQVSTTDTEAVITVRDHGPGIPINQRERVFDRFYSVPGGSQSDRGTGLGLAIAKGVARLHKGFIEASEPEGGGCQLIVKIPLSSFLESY